MIAFGKIFWLNTLAFLAYGVLGMLLFLWPDILLLQYFFSLSILFIALPLAALNIVAISEKLFRQNFDGIETLTLTSLIALVGIPFLLTVENMFFGSVFPELPLINTLVLFFIAILYSPSFLDRFSWKTLASHPLSPSIGIALGAYTALVLALITAYIPLPDSDPYYWFVKLQSEFQHGILPSLQLYRPLFSSLGYIFQVTGQLDFYAFFKYVLPFLGLLVIFPAALIAKFLPTRSQQLITLFLPLTSGATILYFFAPIPQAIFNICLFFWIFFLLYSWLTGKNYFYFFAGGSMIIAYFFHEMALFLIAPWFLVTFICYRKAIFTFMRKQWHTCLLLAILLVSHKDFFTPFLSFLFNWGNRVMDYLSVWKTNFYFPLYFINIDGRMAGWGSLQGVAQYYAFYAGPAFFLSLFFLLLYIRNKKNRNILWSALKEKKEFWLLIIVGGFFLTIAEILPRVANISLLPERAWTAISAISLVFLLLPVILTRKKYQIPTFCLLGALIISIAGALYVNNLKQYLISPEEIEATTWIKNSLPENRILFTHGHWSILKVHAHTDAIDVSNPLFYQDLSIFEALINPPTIEAPTDQSKFLELLEQNRLQLRAFEIETRDPALQEKVILLQRQVREIQTLLENKEVEKPIGSAPVYIFYAKPSTKNPYAARPYFHINMEETFVFDAYPNRFKRVYELPGERVIIWQLIR